MSLAAGQFLGWISALLNRLLTNWWLWAWIIVLFYAAVASAMVGITHSASHGFRVVISVLVYVFVGAELAAVGAVWVILAAAVPFGWDGPFLSIFASCSAEAAPQGQAKPHVHNAYKPSKAHQHALPVGCALLFDRPRPRPEAPTMRGPGAPMAIGLVVVGGRVLLYLGLLRRTTIF
jgi:hypothetical protein